MSDPNNPNPPASPSPEHGNRGGNRPQASKAPGRGQFQAPKGTRDVYPEDAANRRYITEAWRNASIRHGFEEIDGPTFEDADLYKVKSGDGILAEMFGVFSGKSPEDVERVRATGEAPLVLRPEFTPTLARMYAARAAQLGKPTKWFTAGPFFRAEKPQRGRLREFLQWNCDVIGQALPEKPTPEDIARARTDGDAAVIACCADFFESLGLKPSELQIRISDRGALSDLFGAFEIHDGEQVALMRSLVDDIPKLSSSEQAKRAAHAGVSGSNWERIVKALSVPWGLDSPDFTYRIESTTSSNTSNWVWRNAGSDLRRLFDRLKTMGVDNWCKPDLRIVRGLAYYTGMVFEVIADGERAVAGGGRYDNLIELFGGPPTPAVGFGMGDVVLTNLLRDKGLLPEGMTLLDKLSQTPASLRPDAFVLTADESLDLLVRRLVADLRRGGSGGGDRGGGMVAALSNQANNPESPPSAQACSEPQACHPVRPLHARHSYKSTRNVGKLLKEAVAQHARIAVIIESDAVATVKPLDGGEQVRCPISEVRARIAALLGR